MMGIYEFKMRQPVLYICIGVIGVAAAMYFNQSRNMSSGMSLDVKVPEFSANQLRGQVSFDENCAACHGEYGRGSQNGPPLIHKIYETGHHSDGAFFLAAKNGVRRHHWKFGNMAPISGVSNADMELIVGYVRAIQRANGIE